MKDKDFNKAIELKNKVKLIELNKRVTIAILKHAMCDNFSDIINEAIEKVEERASMKILELSNEFSKI